MIDVADLKEINPKGIVHVASADHVQAGLPIPKLSRVQIFSPDDWEEFVEEWTSSLKADYAMVRRFAGAGDMGIDVACFTSGDGFAEPWDNYQCKRYDHPLRPADIHVEVGKIVYYTWLGEYTAPRRHYFAASRDVGTTAAKLLLDPAKLKESVRQAWEKQCRNARHDEMTEIGRWEVHRNTRVVHLESTPILQAFLEGRSRCARELTSRPKNGTSGVRTLGVGLSAHYRTAP